jgi:hypothetical protein
MARYRFLDGMGDVVGERDFPGHAAALAWARDEEELDAEVQRVEYLGPEGDWRWVGALEGRPRKPLAARENEAQRVRTAVNTAE